MNYDVAMAKRRAETQAIEDARMEAERTWAAAGKVTPCHDPDYLAARYRLHQAMLVAGIMKASECDPKPSHMAQK